MRKRNCPSPRSRFPAHLFYTSQFPASASADIALQRFDTFFQVVQHSDVGFHIEREAQVKRLNGRQTPPTYSHRVLFPDLNESRAGQLKEEFRKRVCGITGK